jgi:hypothetical protein
MDNPRMERRSETFQDDYGVVVEKRCFFLACGHDDHDTNYMTITISINVFKEPREPFNIDVQVNLHNTLVELCNEVFLSGTMLLPDFRPFFRYSDLYGCRLGLYRRIELYAPLYAVK